MSQTGQHEPCKGEYILSHMKYDGASDSLSKQLQGSNTNHLKSMYFIYRTTAKLLVMHVSFTIRTRTACLVHS